MIGDVDQNLLASLVAGRFEDRPGGSRRGMRLADSVAKAGSALAGVLEAGGRVLVAGNGGSAAEAQHLTSELVGRFRADRPGLAAIALTGESSALTAIGNDYGFESVFSRQVEALGQPGDALVLLTTSGRSLNVLEAADVARQRGLLVVGISAAGGGPLAERCDVLIDAIPGSTATIQEDHLVIVHRICEVVEHLLFGLTMGPVMPDGPVGVDAAASIVEAWRAEGRMVVWTNGCFDLLHQGHLAVLGAASALDGVVVVGLNSDRSVAILKGPNRPIVPFSERAALLLALVDVDLVVEMDEDEPSALIADLRPDVVLKGADYANGSKPMPELTAIEEYGGRVDYVETIEGISTTRRVADIGGGG